jgi:hypothetical protein
VNGDHISVLDSQVVPHNTVETGASIVEVIIGEHDKHCILALLATNQYRITAEELEGVHSVI